MAEDPLKILNIAGHLNVGIGALAEGLYARKDSRQQEKRVEEQNEGKATPDTGEPRKVSASKTGSISAGSSGGTGRLDLPVILPQRRPKERSRGFVRAYAPLLANVGIDQEMWLKFLNDFEQSTQATGWIKTINLASLAGQAVPEPFSILVSMAVKETIRIAREIDSQQK